MRLKEPILPAPRYVFYVIKGFLSRSVFKLFKKLFTEFKILIILLIYKELTIFIILQNISVWASKDVYQAAEYCPHFNLNFLNLF